MKLWGRYLNIKEGLQQVEYENNGQIRRNNRRCNKDIKYVPRVPNKEVVYKVSSYIQGSSVSVSPEKKYISWRWTWLESTQIRAS